MNANLITLWFMIYGFWVVAGKSLNNHCCFGFLSKGSPMIQNNGNLFTSLFLLIPSMNNELSWHKTNYSFSNTIFFLLCCHLTFHTGLYQWSKQSWKHRIAFHKPMNQPGLIWVVAVLRIKAKLDLKNSKDILCSTDIYVTFPVGKFISTLPESRAKYSCYPSPDRLRVPFKEDLNPS